MDLDNLIELGDCPICRGPGIMSHEGGWNVQVECADCSAHTVYVEYNTEEEKREAERQVAHLWNIAKGYASFPARTLLFCPFSLFR